MHGSAATELDPSSSDGLEHLRRQRMKDLRIQIHGIQLQMRTIENAASGLDSEEKELLLWVPETQKTDSSSNFGWAHGRGESDHQRFLIQRD